MMFAHCGVQHRSHLGGRRWSEPGGGQLDDHGRADRGTAGEAGGGTMAAPGDRDPHQLTGKGSSSKDLMRLPLEFETQSVAL